MPYNGAWWPAGPQDRPSSGWRAATAGEPVALAVDAPVRRVASRTRRSPPAPPTATGSAERSPSRLRRVENPGQDAEGAVGGGCGPTPARGPPQRTVVGGGAGPPPGEVM